MLPIDIFTSSTITATWTALKVYLFWTTLHWGAIQVYQEYCAPKTVIGYFMAPIMTQTHPCKITSWIHRTSTDAFNSMSALVLTWGSTFVLKWQSFKTQK